MPYLLRQRCVVYGSHPQFSCRADQIVPEAPKAASKVSTILNMDWPSSDEEDEDFGDSDSQHEDGGEDADPAAAGTSKVRRGGNSRGGGHSTQEEQEADSVSDDDDKDEDDENDDAVDTDDDDYESDDLDEGEGKLDEEGLRMLQQDKDRKLITGPVECGKWLACFCNLLLGLVYASRPLLFPKQACCAQCKASLARVSCHMSSHCDVHIFLSKASKAETLMVD